jgi:aspartate-semialdehyde dehydrogenase
MKPIKLAVVGATGVVGNMFLTVLEEMNIPLQSLTLFASERSEGKTMYFRGQDYPVVALKETAIHAGAFDYALFSAGSDIALQFAPLFVKQGAIVIDNSSAFRMMKDVPLVVPEVNPEDAFVHQGIIANPNCSTIQAVVAMKPLDDAYRIKRMVISTYQAVSGAGSKGLLDLDEGTLPLKKFPFPIQGNLIPHIDVFLDNGNTKEEEKIILETRKIMHRPDLKISSTAVRVPVRHGHSESLNLEFEKPFRLDDLVHVLKHAPSLTVYPIDKAHPYPMPVEVEGKNDVHVGRIRLDTSVDSGVNMFVVADNIRKGAATNAIQIMMVLMAKGESLINP